jgi:tripartite-type tricarboxylate transporter receptor subunit TctC
MRKRLLGLLALPALALAQPYPDKPVRVLIPFAAGSVLETAVRAVGDRFREISGQPLVVEAKPGAGGIVAVQALLGAPADGGSVLLATQAMLVINPHIYARLPYDPARDLAPVSELFSSPMMLTVHPSVPARTVREFVEWARANHGKVAYGSVSPGTVSHFLAEQLNFEHQTAMTHIPYKGSNALMPDLVGGRIQAAFVSVDTARPHLAAGKLAALMVSGAQRSPQLPSVPTAREAGFPALEANAWSGFVVRAGTPAAVAERLDALARESLSGAEVRSRLDGLGQTVVGSREEEFAAKLAKESLRWQAVVRATGFKADP